ncbi:glycerate kinase [Paenisporosarcina quisquiliarum]|uniref:Glycerate kinase n=1 Tax=Paenisporosarcina quisquiliarum TaxID=365346 RepID=A0A9X3RF84_9BACL|nr:glycerate kinase [Paenisporosarcina quisquiliarum]
MKIVISPDSFKGSLAADKVAQAMAAGIRAFDQSIETLLLPVADGGEGTLESLISATNGRFVPVVVQDPLERKITADYGVLGDEETCVIEMAKASGLTLLHKEERNPLNATSYGTGELIKHALDAGFRKFIVGIGGSATNDGGVGMLKALGMKFQNCDGASLGSGGGALDQLSHIDMSEFDPRIRDSKFIIACDVDNPFIGTNGASHVFGPQKGATESDVSILDRNLKTLADVIERTYGVSIHYLQGAGAAGGLGGAFQAFFPLTMKPGIEVVMEAIGFHEQIKNADLVITGEGRSDEQTLSGKAPYGVAKVAKEHGIPVMLLSGYLEPSSKKSLSLYFDVLGSVVNEKVTQRESMENPAHYLKIQMQQMIVSYEQMKK